MFGSLKNRLKKIIGIAKETDERTEPAGELTTVETVETTKGDEKIETMNEEEIKEEQKEVLQIKKEDMKAITLTSIPLTQKHVPLSLAGKEARMKMIEEYNEEDREKIEKEAFVPAEHVQEIATGEIDRKTGLLKRFKKAVTEKTLAEADINPIISELQNALIENDVALKVAEDICEHVKKQLMESSVPRSRIGDEIKNSLRQAIRMAMTQVPPDIDNMIKQKPNNEPLLVVFLGFNGSGKTTTMAKIAKKYMRHNPVFAAADTFRAASIEQLEKHGKALNVDVVKHNYGADPAAVIFDARKHAVATGSRLVLADTAGRSHGNTNLMDELRKIVRVNKPDLNILVLDALTGNDIYEQSKRFDEAVDVDAIILAKADVYSKGGACLSASHTIGKPIMFLGTGQKYDDLMMFDPDKIADNLLG